jgi:hypothetical protein
MIIQLYGAEAKLFQRWLAYNGGDTPQKRTEAFFAARRGESPPLTSRRGQVDEHILEHVIEQTRSKLREPGVSDK